MSHGRNTSVADTGERDLSTRSGSVSKVRILVVDDSPSVRSALRKFLEQDTRWRVCGEAEDGREAVDRTLQLKPDLVIMDFLMPVLDGIHAAEEISASSPELPILLCTMFASSQLVQKARSAGIRGVLPKTSIARISEAIGELLSGRSFFPALPD